MKKNKKEREVKEVLKNEDKPYKFWTTTKKIFAGIIVAVIVAGAAIGLAVGLTSNNNNVPTPPSGPSIEQPSNPGNPGVIVPPEQEKPGDGEIVNPDPGPENPDPDNPNQGGDQNPEVKIENVGDLLQNHAQTLNNALNKNLFENVGKDVINRFFKTEKASNIDWYVQDGKDANSIKGFDLKFNYDAGSGSERYIVCSVKLQDAIQIADLHSANGITNETITNAIKAQADNLECAQKYSFTYTEADKTTNIELKNAICDKLFGKNETAERYIVDVGHKIDSEGLSDVREFKVVEITENGVQEKTVWIKDNGKDYQENFEKGEYREVYEAQKVDFTGNKIEQSAESLADYMLEMPDGSYFELC